MFNLQIGDNDLIGNKFNGHDLHLYLREKNWKSSHIVLNKESKDPNTYPISQNSNLQTERNFIINLEKKYNIHALLSPLPFEIINSSLFLNTNIVHYHLVHNYMFNIQMFPLLTSLKPSVITLHDPWFLSGHCIYHFDCERWKTGCGDCPQLKIPFEMNQDNTALNFELKRRAIQDSQFEVIVASDWMRNKVEQSPIWDGKNIYKVPFGINQNLFKPKDIKQAKQNLGIDQNSIVLMLRSQTGDFKGLDILKNALNQIQSNNTITLITVAQKELFNDLKNKYKILEYGWLKDDARLVELYQACDIFLMPSKVEAFGMMAIEAMSCQKMVLSIEGTALPEVINAPYCGISTKATSNDYANELQRLINNLDEVQERGQKSLEYAKQNYNYEAYVNKIISVYDKAISNHKLDNRSIYILGQLNKHMKQELTPDNPQNLSKEANKPNLKTKLRLFLLKIINKLKIIYDCYFPNI